MRSRGKQRGRTVNAVGAHVSSERCGEEALRRIRSGLHRVQVAALQHVAIGRWSFDVGPGVAGREALTHAAVGGIRSFAVLEPHSAERNKQLDLKVDSAERRTRQRAARAAVPRSIYARTGP